MEKDMTQQLKIEFFKEVKLKFLIIKLLFSFSFLIAASTWFDIVYASTLTTFIIFAVFIVLLFTTTFKELKLYLNLEQKIRSEYNYSSKT